MSDQAFEIRHVRGVLMTTLHSYFPNGLAAKTLFRTAIAPIFPSMRWETVLQQILYLHERGFLEAIGQSGIGKEHSLEKENYRLTPSGLDIALGVVHDQAIDVEV